MKLIKDRHQLYHKSNDKAIPAKGIEIVGDVVIVHKHYLGPIELPINSVGICNIDTEDEYDIRTY